MTPWGSHTKKLEEPGLKYSSLIPNNLTAALSVKTGETQQKQTQHHSIGNSVFVAQQHLINSESLPHLLGKKSHISNTLWAKSSQIERLKSLWKKPSINSLYKCQSWFPPPWAAWLAVPPPGTAVSLAKSTCPAPSFNCHEFSKFI